MDTQMIMLLKCMSENYMKKNDSETEFIIIRFMATTQNLPKDSLKVNETSVQTSNFIKYSVYIWTSSIERDFHVVKYSNFSDSNKISNNFPIVIYH